jgi:hypothetical protein
LDELGQDAEWLFNTNVKNIYAKQGCAVETAFKNDPVYCMQTIKLPFACEQTFSKRLPEIRKNRKFFTFLSRRSRQMWIPRRPRHNGSQSASPFSAIHPLELDETR